MSENSAEKWVSIDAIAEHLDVSKDTVYRWIKKQGMPASQIDRKWKFKISQVDGWMQNKSRKYS